MQLFAPSIAFVDLETTGTRAAGDRITEVGIVRVDTDPGGGTPRVEEWSSLVDPGVPVPAAIQALTGITDAMLRGAPTFSSVAEEIAGRLEGALFVAHNARFDHGFLKQEFARLQRPFRAKVLCTVRLSRRLYPGEASHSLDAVIARHALAVDRRHRALGDARALWSFVQAVYATHPAAAVDAAVRSLLKIPSLPAQLPPDALEAIPAAPGVYLFYGDNPLPLYIGKAGNLRERVAAHFSSDWANETDLRLSAELRRIEVKPTAGELGALLHESALIKTLSPAHNRALRRKAEAGVMVLRDDGAPTFAPADALADGTIPGSYGPFTSRRAMRNALLALAHTHALCWKRLGLERRLGPCFARQLKHCRGACDEGESAPVHDARLRAALEPLVIPRWPFDGPALIREAHDERVEVHVVRDWSWLGTARDDDELETLVDASVTPAFDVDVTRLLLRLWKMRPWTFVAPPRGRGDRA